jgi:hypothetical protein
MKNSIYVDGVSNIVMVDGVVRFDLVTLATTQALPKDTPPQLEVVTSVATTLPGFLRLHEQILGAVNNMIEQGLIKKNLDKDLSIAETPATKEKK